MFCSHERLFQPSCRRPYSPFWPHVQLWRCICSSLTQQSRQDCHHPMQVGGVFLPFCQTHNARSFLTLSSRSEWQGNGHAKQQGATVLLTMATGTDAATVNEVDQHLYRVESNLESTGKLDRTVTQARSTIWPRRNRSCHRRSFSTGRSHTETGSFDPGQKFPSEQ
jgi:hypothetical protein